jgi:hypothetical protein
MSFPNPFDLKVPDTFPIPAVIASISLQKQKSHRPAILAVGLWLSVFECLIQPVSTSPPNVAQQHAHLRQQNMPHPGIFNLRENSWREAFILRSA